MNWQPMKRTVIIKEIEKPEGMSAEDELAWALSRVLRWQNPLGTVMDYYIPSWLREYATDALKRYLEPPQDTK